MRLWKIQGFGNGKLDKREYKVLWMSESGQKCLCIHNAWRIKDKTI